MPTAWCWSIRDWPAAPECGEPSRRGEHQLLATAYRGQLNSGG
jgi:hypothetical protein